MFIEELWHDVQKGSGYILRSISSQKLALYPANNDLVDLLPNLWCNNFKAIFFQDVFVFVLDITLISPKQACFLCAICGSVTACFSFHPKYTVHNSLWNEHLCPKFINLNIENNLSNKSCTKSRLCNVAIKKYPLLSHIFICTCPFCFALTWCLYATSIGLFVSSNKPGKEFETSGVMWNVVPEYKIQLVHC